MAVTIVGSSTAVVSDGAADSPPSIFSVTVDVPSGTTAGDFVLLVLYYHSVFHTLGAFTPPAGFSVLADTYYQQLKDPPTWLYSKTLTGPETADSYTITCISDFGEHFMAATCIVIRGGQLDPDFPVNNFFDNPDEPGHNDVTQTTSLITSQDGLVIALFNTRNVDFPGFASPVVTAPPEMTELWTLDDGLTSGYHLDPEWHRQGTVVGAYAIVPGGTSTFNPGTLDYNGNDDYSAAYTTSGLWLGFIPASSVASGNDEKIFARGALGYGFARGFA